MKSGHLETQTFGETQTTSVSQGHKGFAVTDVCRFVLVLECGRCKYYSPEGKGFPSGSVTALRERFPGSQKPRINTKSHHKQTSHKRFSGRETPAEWLPLFGEKQQRTEKMFIKGFI